MTRTNLVKDENGDMLADTHSIRSGQKNYLCQLLNVRWVTLLETVPQYRHQIIPHYMQIFSFKIFMSEWSLGWTNDFLIMFSSF